MTRLKQSDLTAFSRALTILYADTGAGTLSGRILATMRRLFDCDFASFSLLNLRQGRWHFAQISPAVREWPGFEVYRHYLRDDPVAAHILRNRVQRALKISDFRSLREYRASRLYAEVFHPVGCDRRLGFAVTGASPVNMAATVNRKGRDFSEEERAMLDLLRPHLLQANSLAHADRLAVAARLGAQKPGRETFGVGLVELDLRGGVRWMTPRAEVLLRLYFPRAGNRVATGRLPGTLERQIKPSLRADGFPLTPHPLVAAPERWHFPGPDGGQLKVRLVGRGSAEGRQLLLEEKLGYAATMPLALALGLSPRQGEVLHWVAEGKTNREISVGLGIAENTVGKHLEHILSRLQVPNRTAAVRAIHEARAAL